MKKRLLLTLALASLAAFLVAQSPPPPPAPTESAKEEQHAGPSEKPDTDSSQQSIVGPTQEAENAKPQGSERGDKASTDWWITAFTGILTLVGIIQLVAMFKQASYMRQGLDATNKAADAATVSANVATQALKDSKEALQLTERAMIRMESVSVHTMKDSRPFIHKVTSVSFKLKNFGKTEARAVKITGKLCLGEKEDSLAGRTEIAIPPQGRNVPFSRSLSHWLDDAEITAITNREATLCYEIKATYKDVFNVGYSYTATGVWNEGSRSFSIRTDSETII